MSIVPGDINVRNVVLLRNAKLSVKTIEPFYPREQSTSCGAAPIGCQECKLDIKLCTKLRLENFGQSIYEAEKRSTTG